MHLFGGAKKKDKPEANPHDGITKLKETEAQLTKRKEVMEHKASEVHPPKPGMRCLRTSYYHKHCIARTQTHSRMLAQNHVTREAESIHVTILNARSVCI